MLLRLFFVVLCMIPLGFASEEYADLSFDIDSQGNVFISGIDSAEEFTLNTQLSEYTSKKGSVWTLEIESKTIYDQFIFESLFPEGSEISYIKTTPSFRIDDSDGRLSIIGTGENKPLTLQVQYQISNEANYSSLLKDPLLIGGLGIIFGLLLGNFVKVFLRQKKEQKEIKKEIDVVMLPERQREIVSYLKQKGKVTQKELETYMQIPKASVSRNVKTLEVKGYIKKEQVGNTNYLSLEK